jgi:hypothetical protein
MTFEVKHGGTVAVPGSVYTQTQSGKYVVQIDSGPYAADQLAPWASAEEWEAIGRLVQFASGLVDEDGQPGHDLADLADLRNRMGW